jgi:hypothetical protein
MSSLYALSLALKVGMLIDAVHRRPAFGWFLVIVLLPAGELVYLALVMAPEVLPGRRRVPKARRLPLEELRYRCRENPCHANRLALADRLRVDGATGEARGLYESLLAGAPDDPAALHGLALALLDAGETDEAIRVLERVVAVRRSFRDYAAWLRLGETLSAAGRHDEALDCFERLVRTAPRIAHQVARAQAQAAAGEPDAARATLEAALEDYHHSPRFLRREAREPARRATKLLGEIRAAAA